MKRAKKRFTAGKAVFCKMSAVPSCCGVKLLHNFRGAADILSPQHKSLYDRLTKGTINSYQGLSAMAITSSQQTNAEAALKSAGFTKSKTWRAASGSMLTLWHRTQKPIEA